MPGEGGTEEGKGICMWVRLRENKVLRRERRDLDDKVGEGGKKNRKEGGQGWVGGGGKGDEDEEGIVRRKGCKEENVCVSEIAGREI